jgi:acetyl-CoA carboxylase carboxyltransferase component
VAILKTKIDTSSQEYTENKNSLLEKLNIISQQMQLAIDGGGEKYIQRHKKRGKLLARERIELLLDRSSAFLELSPLAAWGTNFTVGASLVTGIGTVCGTECLIFANDPTVKGGSTNPYTLKKLGRAADIASENSLPTISLIESGGADLPTQAELFIPGGRMFRDLTQRSSKGLPTISLVFGNSTAGGAYVPGMSDYIVMIKNRSKVFLGGPPLVKMATGEESTDEELGGAEMHSKISGLSDYLAEDEQDAIRLGRQIVSRLNYVKKGAARRTESFCEPIYDSQEILGIITKDPKVPFDPREILARIVDGSEFDEFKPDYGTSLVTGFAEISGYPVGILANHRGILFNKEAQKATQFIQLANQINTPLIFFQNTTGYIVGKDYEQDGIIKDGAKMINAVSNSRVPHITIVMGASYGAGNYGMCGRAFNPRFLFSWPNAKSAVMGKAQLAGVMAIVAKQSAQDRGLPFDEEANEMMRQMIEDQIERESEALFLSSLLYDDGIIDPRDTRNVLSMCLSVVHNNEITGTLGYGIYRM